MVSSSQKSFFVTCGERSRTMKLHYYIAIAAFLGFFAVLPAVALFVPNTIVRAQTTTGGSPYPYPITPPVQTVTQTFNWETGYNLFGLTVDKGSDYRASDLLNDLNWSFVDLPPKPMGGGYYGALQVIYRWNTESSKWEYYTTWGAGNNFSIRIGEGYVIRNYYNASGSSISGTGVSSSVYLVLVAEGWTLISLPENRGVSTAEQVLQSMQANDINAVILAKYDAQRGRYTIHYAGSTELNNFSVSPGDGFWVYRADGGTGRW